MTAFAQLRLVVLFSMLVCESANAGGWTQPDGQFYLKLTDRFLIGSRYFDRTGDLVEVGGDYADHRLSVYGEFRLTPSITLTGQVVPVGFARFQQKTASGAESAFFFGGGWVGLRHDLGISGPSLAVEARAGFTSIETQLGTVNASAAPASAAPVSFVTGKSSGFAEIESQIGATFAKWFWSSASLGARFHTASEVGVGLSSNLQLGYASDFGLVTDLHLSFFWSMSEVGAGDVLGVGRTRYVGVGLTVSYWVTDRFGLTVGADSAVFARNNAGTVPITIGIELR